MNISTQNSLLQQTKLNTELDTTADLVKSASTDTLLVSVIIPVYNSSKYIQKAIDSILAQTYSNYEIIVVDDGSTDSTKAKLEQYKHKIRYIYQENQGSAAARNIGIKLAQGELIAFLDADDLWSMPQKLEKQVACFVADPDLGGVNTGWRIIDGAGKHIKTVQPWHKAPKLDLETWLKKKCVRTSAMIFRHEWLEKVGGFDPEIRQSHDVDLILRLSLAGCKTIWLKEETVCYRQHEENTTKNSLKQAKYVQAVLDKFFSRQDLPKSIRQQEKQIKYHTLVWIAWYQYYAGNLDAMASYLQKSLAFSPYLKVKNISHWLTSFKRFSQTRGDKFQTNVVTNSPQWNQLIATILGLPIVGKQIISSNSSSDADLQQTKVKLETKSTPELAALADEKAKQQELEAAIALYSKALELEPDAWKIHRKLGMIYRQQGQLGLSLNHFQQTLKIQPNIGEIYTDVGQTLAQLGKFDEAIAAYKRGIKIEPEQPWSYFKLAALQEKQYDFAAAAENLQKAIEYNPDYSTFHRNLARIQQLEKSINAGSPVKKISSFSSNNSLINFKVFPAEESLLLPSISDYDTVDNGFDFARHATPESYVSVIRNGRILVQQGYGYIITPDNDILKNLCVNPNAFDTSSHPPKCHRISGSVAWLSLVDGCEEDLLHAAFDLVARLELLKLSGVNLSSINYFIVDKLYLKNSRDILALIGLDFNKVLTTEKYDYVSADILFVPSFASGNQKISKWACQSMNKSICSQEVERRKDLPKLIYIKSDSEDKAKIANESQLIECLEKLNFVTVNIDSISLSDFILYMKNAKAIITTNKLALKYLYICQIGCKVIEIFTNDISKTHWILSNVSNLEHYHVVAKPMDAGSGETNKINNYDLFSVSLQSIQKVLIKSRLLT